MPKFFLITCAVLASLTASAVFAAPVIAIPTERTGTTGFVGLTLPIAPSPMPRISIGLRQTTVGSGGDVVGGAVEFSFDPWNKGGMQVRATALKGDVDLAGILGGGWNFGTGRPFVTLGARVPNLSASADIGAGGVPAFALGFDSLGKETAPDPELVGICGFPFSGSNALAC